MHSSQKLSIGQARSKRVPRSKTALAHRLDAARGYNAAADSYDDWNWQRIWQTVEWPIINKKLRALPPPRRILDIGVGTGVYLFQIAKLLKSAKLYGIDVSESMLSVAKRKLGRRAMLQHGSAISIPFDDGQFDIVLMCRVASHIRDLPLVLREIARILSERGVAIITDVHPGHHYACTAIPTVFGKVKISTFKHTMDDWRQACRTAGFIMSRPKVIRASSITKDIDFELPDSIDRSTHQAIGFVLTIRKSKNACSC